MARILLIEDEPVVRAVLSRALAAAGHDVLDAANTTGAPGLVNLFGADIVIADVMLRGQDGIAALLAIRAAFPKLPLVAVSGRDRAEITGLLSERGLQSEVWVLTKPFAQEELLSIVKTALPA